MNTIVEALATATKLGNIKFAYFIGGYVKSNDSGFIDLALMGRADIYLE